MGMTRGRMPFVIDVNARRGRDRETNLECLEPGVVDINSSFFEQPSSLPGCVWPGNGTTGRWQQLHRASLHPAKQASSLKLKSGTQTHWGAAATSLASKHGRPEYLEQDSDR